MKHLAAVALTALVTAQAPTTAPLALETFDAAWATIHETYYDPAFRGVDWQAVRDELRPRAAEAPTTQALRAVITEMLARLGESHFAVLPQSADIEDAASLIATDRSGSPGFDVRAHEGDLYVVTVERDSPAAAVDRHRHARGIVLDLRGNPGGLAGMIMGVSGHFFGERTALGTMTSRTNTLTFYANPRRSRPDGTRVEPYQGRVAILVDGLTGSASECFAGGMQAVGRARVFGQTSMGQALPASFSALPNGDTLLHAIADFVTADGTRLEGRGVVPDVPVPFEPSALAAGRDPVLEAALAWIDSANR